MVRPLRIRVACARQIRKRGPEHAGRPRNQCSQLHISEGLLAERESEAPVSGGVIQPVESCAVRNSRSLRLSERPVKERQCRHDYEHKYSRTRRTELTVRSEAIVLTLDAVHQSRGPTNIRGYNRYVD